MGIPLQALNIRPAPDPFLRVEQIASGLQNMRAQQAHLHLAQQQAAQQAPVSAAHAQLLTAQAQAVPGHLAAQQQLNDLKIQAAQQKAAFLEKNPLARFGATGQSLAAINYMSQPGKGLGGGALAAPQAQEASPPTLGKPIPPQTGQDIALAKIQHFQKSVEPTTAASLGMQFQDPHKTAMADAMVRKIFPTNYQSVRAAMVPSQQYALMPADFRRQEIAKLANFMNPEVANQYLASGGNLRSLGQHLGIPDSQMDQLVAQYAPQTAVLNQVQRQGWSSDVFNTVSPLASKWLAPYVRSVEGVSPKMMEQLLFKQGSGGNFKKAKDQDAIAKALAAGAMQMELVGLRIQGGGLRTNKSLINMAYKNSNSNLRIFQSLLKPETYIKSQQYLGQLLSLAHDASNKFVSHPSATPSNLPAGLGAPSQAAPGGDTVRVRFKNGDEAEIPKSLLDQAKSEKGATLIG